MFKLSLIQLLRIVSARSATTNAVGRRFQLVRSQICLTHCRNAHTKAVTSNDAPDEDKTEERELLTRLQNDPDIFGHGYVKEPVHEDDLKEEEFISNPPPVKRLSTKQYADIIKDLISKRKIKEAIDVVEIRMLKEDKVKPDNYIFNLVIGACGRVGYTKKAFSLYNEMKRRSLNITPGTYTALFNACANSPWLKDGLARAKHLHQIIIEKHYEPNDTNYNAMIKAYGRCGDLKTAFAVVDEMLSKKFHIKDDTINFLLQACITDKEAGFRHALLVWRKFIDKRIQPSEFSYNLMLRCIRDCGLGDLDVSRDVIAKILPENDKFLCLDPGKIDDYHDDLQLKQSNPKTQEDNEQSSTTRLSTDVSLSESEGVCNAIGISSNKEISFPKKEFAKVHVDNIIQNRPNLMAKVPHMGDIISLSEVKRAEDRLLLVGGVSVFLQDMTHNRCTPDIKTFTQLLECMPSALSAEKELIVAMRKLNVKPDVDFYNILIKKRSMRMDYDAAREVLQMMTRSGYKPNLVTYGVLALGCKNKEEAQELIAEMKEKNYILNVEILGAMLHQACYHFNFGYVLEIMEICRKEQIAPNKIFLERLEKFKKTVKDASNDSNSPLFQTLKFHKGYQIFRMRYKSWCTQVQVEDEEHPWQQFRQTTDTNVLHYKDKSVQFKPRHQSEFRVKTSPKWQSGERTKNYTKNFKTKPKQFGQNKAEKLDW